MTDARDLAEAGEYVVGETFGAGSVAGRPLENVEFEDCTFEGIVFDDMSLRRCSFRDCRFERCSLSGMTWPDTSINGCRFTDCRLVGTSFSVLAPSVVLDPCVFEGCRLQMCSFVGRDLSGWIFRGGGLLESDVEESDLRRARIECDLTGTVFRSCDLRDADLRGSRPLVLDLRANQVRGLRVDADAAVSLLTPFGLVVD